MQEQIYEKKMKNMSLGPKFNNTYVEAVASKSLIVSIIQAKRVPVVDYRPACFIVFLVNNNMLFIKIQTVFIC